MSSFEYLYSQSGAAPQCPQAESHTAWQSAAFLLSTALWAWALLGAAELIEYSPQWLFEQAQAALPLL